MADRNINKELYAGNKIKVFTGLYFDFNEPTEEMVTIEDIAHALSNIPRWGGHTNEFYSVAQHSIRCMDIAWTQGSSREVAFEALMHDAHEAYLLDMPKPIKDMLPQYKILEARVDKVIRSKYKMLDAIPKEVKDIDVQVLREEWLYFQHGVGSINSFNSLPVKECFISSFNRLRK